MRQVNVTMNLCTAVRYDGNGQPCSFLGMFDSLDVDADGEGLPAMPGFRTVVRICVLGSGRNGVLERSGKIEFRLRLTKCDPDPENRVGTDLAAFVLDLGDPGIMDGICASCVEYLNYIHIINVGPMKLEPGFGEYAVKLLAAEKEDGRKLRDEDFTVRSLYSLMVGRRAGN